MPIHYSFACMYVVDKTDLLPGHPLRLGPANRPHQPVETLHTCIPVSTGVHISMYANYIIYTSTVAHAIEVVVGGTRTKTL